MKDTDLKGCIYNHYKNRYCPIFRLGDIVSEAKEKFSAMAVEVKPASTLGHTLPFKSLGSVRLLMFFKTFLLLIKDAFIWSKNTERTVILWNIITI